MGRDPNLGREGSKSRAKVIQLCQNELFLFIFQVLSILS